jgi:hypothetical protein
VRLCSDEGADGKEITMKNRATASNWTIRTASDSKRGSVTHKTVSELSRAKSLRGVAKVAKKYAK